MADVILDCDWGLSVTVAALTYQCRCRGLRAGLSGVLFDLETAACGRSPPSHPTPTEEQTETDVVQK